MSATGVIADDEPLLRAQLRSRLARLWPDLTVVHEMENGRDVEDVLQRHGPSVFFLDVHMPGVNGLEAARRIAGRAHVVFVTAYDEHAVEAFERGAVDYVLKPFTEERLALAIQRLRERLQAAPAHLEELVQTLAARLAPVAAPQYLRWIKASVGPHVRLIPVEEVVFFQSDDKYTRVVTCEGEALIRKPIRELLDELDPELFWQVHRATIVNVDRIASVRRGLKDQAEILLRERPETLVVSRAFTHRFRQM
ncbi:MAG TPA: LytTR family DNA-binding domain-containing protein [Usitatibacter sp.]|nr:LytTR family DNA-binding domain-containing protein [Usitatibacter sp.]